MLVSPHLGKKMRIEVGVLDYAMEEVLSIVWRAKMETSSFSLKISK